MGIKTPNKLPWLEYMLIILHIYPLAEWPGYPEARIAVFFRARGVELPVDLFLGCITAYKWHYYNKKKKKKKK